MSLRVQFFNPPVFWYSGVRYVMNPPLGLPILASVLKNAGHQCGVTDLEALGVGPKQVGQAFGNHARRPDWVGFTALTSSATGMKACVAEVRQAGYEGKIVVGGVHATLEPEAVLALGVDLVVTGECEGNIVELLESGATGIHKGVPMPIEDIPAPGWGCHSPLPGMYGGNHPHIIPGLAQGISMWTRGCPGACTFCGNVVFGHQRIRYRLPESIESEVRLLRDMFAAKSLFVYDDELVGVRLPDGWLSEVADRLAPTGVWWKCQGRCSEQHITEQVLRDLNRAGCQVVMWGVESFSPRVLKAMKKGTTPDDIWHTLRLAKQAGLRNWLFTMIGNYQETDEDLAETADCLATAYKEGLVDYRQTTVVTALPGTELEAIQKREGWYQRPPETGAQMHQSYHNTPWLTADRIDFWRKRFDEVCPVGVDGPMGDKACV